MRLKNMKLSGFKSFVDPTTVPFEKNLIAVVGPNGCGKSNIVDGIRWVMGEGSAKNLRGESMADVIFNGSSARQPVGQASVQLTFDNSDGAIGGQYAQYAEISIKRVASRDGTSEYFLNNTKCRRKDITDVFLGTGLGPRSYSVIEQGMISRFIEAKPDELRVYLEEAAGISKYKERRRETETRIRHTRENLARVEDLREEIGTQLEKLHRQAQAAERYKVLKQDERLNKAQLYALHWQELDTQMQNFAQIIQTAEAAIEQQIAEQRRYGAQIENLRETQIDASDELNTVQGRYYSLSADIAKTEQSIAHHKERYQQLQADKHVVEQSVQELQKNHQSDQQQLANLQQELIQVEPQFTSAKKNVLASHQAVATAEQAMQHWRQEWEAFSQAAAQSLTVAEVAQTRMKHAQERIKEFTLRIETLTHEQSQLDLTELSIKTQQLQTNKEAMEAQTQQFKFQLSKINEQIAQQSLATENISQQSDLVKEKLQQAKGRFASLTALQQAALGEQNQAVTKWLAKNNLQHQPRLAQQLKVTADWERAVETVLGSHLEAVAVADLEDLDNLLSELPNFTVEFYQEKTQHNLPAEADKLSAKVSGATAIIPLLNNIYCATDLVSAKKLLSKLQDNESVITPDGIWLSKNWLRVAKDQDAKAGILHRENQLNELKAEIAQLEQQIAELHKQIEHSKQTQISHAKQKENLQQELDHANHQLASARAEYQVKQDQLQQNKIRLEKIAVELTDYQHKLRQNEQILADANTQWQHAVSNNEHHATRKLELESLGDEYETRLNKMRAQNHVDSERAHQLEVRIEQLKPQITTLMANIARTEKQLQTLFERNKTLAASLDKGEGPVAELQNQLTKILDQRVTAEHELTVAKQKVEHLTQQMRELEEAKENVVQQVEQMRRDLETRRLEGRTVDVRKQALEEQSAELGYTLTTVLQELPSEASIAAWEEELQRILNRITRLGAINLAAIDEYKVQEERKQYLDSQYNDLVEALTTLENAIHKIDKETRSRFKETFDKVNDEFQRLFPKVFGGGSAHLELTGQDLLDTGINVIARPPGKRNTTIHLLSGGEKALTAVSLVFAIFQLNPAPFCLLDEVDAPLDDNNVGRFCALVKEMSAKVQFLFISHNKLAIEMAEQLTGVTMQEPGVSRIVAVNMEEAVQLAAA